MSRRNAQGHLSPGVRKQKRLDSNRLSQRKVRNRAAALQALARAQLGPAALLVEAVNPADPCFPTMVDNVLRIAREMAGIADRDTYVTPERLNEIELRPPPVGSYAFAAPVPLPPLPALPPLPETPSEVPTSPAHSIGWEIEETWDGEGFVEPRVDG